MKARTIAITGGIGSGKSVVSRVLRTRGYTVVDTDAHARMLMDTSLDIKRRLVEEIHPLVVLPDGSIDRKRLADIVFADSLMLARLNAIVHSAVCRSLEDMVAACTEPVLFVETALLFQSGLNRSVDAEWRVESPLELRISRVMRRNNLSRSEVEARIASQNHTPAPAERRPPFTVIHNDTSHPLLPQIDAALTAARL